MKNSLLIRGGATPFDEYTAYDMLTTNLIGENLGNLIYNYSIYRGLMVDEETKIDSTKYKFNYTDADVDYINENYSHFIIPLADAFRRSFIGEMDILTDLINKLKIPCILTGAGLREPFVPRKYLSYKFDDNVKEFIKAILNKSSIVGLRGEKTAEYLKNLGFREEIDYTVIGCPSMYIYGKDIDVRTPSHIDKEIRIAFNNNIVAGRNVHEFIDRMISEYEKHAFFPQRINELLMLYTGSKYLHKQSDHFYPDSVLSEVYKEDNVHFNLDARSWIDDLSEFDLSIGPRLHGNVAAIMAGTPAIWLLCDTRMNELARYHNLPSVRQDEIDEGSDLIEIINRVDLRSFRNGHEERFIHYVDFLNKNGVPNIWNNYENPKESVFDKRVNSMKRLGRVSSVYSIDKNELLERINEITAKIYSKNHLYTGYADDEFIDYLEKANLELKGEISLLNSKCNGLKSEKAQLNSEYKQLKKDYIESTRRLSYRIRRKVRKLINVIRGSEGEG